ncbi:uncharacterized protein LOC125499743 [Athalia rosae]|uniref:uncharacterized protein LOC125499743 n=1 Tax=Athalia rosae TaxID=37344 RepID=UPI002033A0D4|nr:uncharacterized protein LOC125499743 [Athalia rosae]XP_048505036.1 uncharacterized protein LOC125499743 [Athalia rosae]
MVKMLKTVLFVVIAVVQCLAVKGKPNEDSAIEPRLPAQQGHSVDMFRPRSDWSYFHPSWSLPSMPSMADFFKDDEKADEPSEIMKRLTALEQRLKEMDEILKRQSSGIKKPEVTSVTTTKVEVLPCKESPPKTTPDKVPEKINEQPQAETTDKKPEMPSDPAKPDKDEKKPEISNKPSIDNEPVKPTEVAQGENSERDSLPAANAKVLNPPSVEDEAILEESIPRKKRV